MSMMPKCMMEDGYGTDISDDIIMHLLESLKKGEGETHYFSCSIGFGFLNVRIDNETYEYSNGKSFDDYIKPVVFHNK